MTPRQAGTPMRILVATDGSDDATAAVEWLRHLPLPAERDVTVLTVVTPPLLPAVPDVASNFRGALLADARRLADETAARLLTGRASGSVVEGDPREEIVKAAAIWGADLIVLGARGLGAVKEFLLGSVSLGVARHASCPVLVCKGTPREVETVTVGVDGSEPARRALAWFAALPLAPAVRVRLVGVAEPQRHPSTVPARVREGVQRAVAVVEAERRTVLEGAVADAATVVQGRVKVEAEVMTGTPAEALVRDAARHGSGLLVVGARGAGAITRWLLGSVSESVLRHAGCPVLVVRPRGRS
jgi:nucleotide-binding universal stress UspA family protein